MLPIFRPALLLAAALLLTGAFGAQASTISVPTSGAGQHNQGIDANNLKPLDCAALNLSDTIDGGNIQGSSSSELILGGSNADTISGGAGDDCIIGGAGVDTLSGGAGTDVCLGGAGTDVFDATCETAIQ